MKAQIRTLEKHFRRIFRKSSIYKKTFSGPDGEFVLGDIIRESGMCDSSYVDQNANGTAYNEGMRRLGIYVTNLMNMSPEEVKRVADAASDADRQANDMEVLYGGETG